MKITYFLIQVLILMMSFYGISKASLLLDFLSSFRSFKKPYETSAFFEPEDFDEDDPINNNNSDEETLFEKPLFADLRVKSKPQNYHHYFVKKGPFSINSQNIQHYQQAKPHYGKIIKSVVFVPPSSRGKFLDNVKPVTENLPDDLKYDFRTKTHSI